MAASPRTTQSIERCVRVEVKGLARNSSVKTVDFEEAVGGG